MLGNRISHRIVPGSLETARQHLNEENPEIKEEVADDLLRDAVKNGHNAVGGGGGAS